MHAARLDPETLLSAYAQGAFPMTDADGVTRWYTADPRGVIPLDDAFTIHRSLRQVLRHGGFETRINAAFDAVIRACASVPRDGEGAGTWIGEELIQAYTRLHQLGYAHSVEAWHEGELVGGLYGVSLGGAFFGESMFHTRRDASKVALVGLVQRMRERKFTLLDSQASTPHLKTFGCTDVPADKYMRLLNAALTKECVFD
ncbi:MAG: leucyl/phenylalanyl-tRNA--protein transferase [Phycisphaerae bacterium]